MKYIADLHTHTVACGHAYSTLTENMMEAHKKGLKVYGVSEHAPMMPGGAHIYFFHNIKKVVPQYYEDVLILKGAEANILNLEGKLDLEEGSLKRLDYIIASLHVPVLKSGTKEENTDCLIKTMQNPYVTIIAHPDDSRFPLDYERLVLASKEYGVLLEVNNSSLNPLASRVGGRENILEYLKLCKKYQVPIILGTDSHYHPQVGDFSESVKLLEEVGFPEDLVANSDLDFFMECINKKKEVPLEYIR